MTCVHPAYRPIEWVVRSAFERLANSPADSDLTFYVDMLGKVRAAVGDDPPVGVLEALHRLEHTLREREAIQARAARVLTER